MADARDMQLELVGGGEHDWTQLFYQFGLLGQESVAKVSTATHHLGVIVMVAATVWVVFPWRLTKAGESAGSGCTAWYSARFLTPPATAGSSSPSRFPLQPMELECSWLHEPLPSDLRGSRLSCWRIALRREASAEKYEGLCGRSIP